MIQKNLKPMSSKTNNRAPILIFVFSSSVFHLSYFNDLDHEYRAYKNIHSIKP